MDPQEGVFKKTLASYSKYQVLKLTMPKNHQWKYFNIKNERQQQNPLLIRSLEAERF